MNLFIARHAESEHNSQNRIQGQGDSSLTPKGKRQALCLARRLRRDDIKIIYSSDLERAKETALIVSKTLKVPIKFNSHLREINLGTWEGKTPEEVDSIYKGAYKKWLSGPSQIDIPGAETIKSFRQRAISVFKDICQKNRKDCLVITHGGVLVAFLAYIIKADFDSLLLRLQMPNTGLTKLLIHQKHPYLCFLNETSHLL